MIIELIIETEQILMNKKYFNLLLPFVCVFVYFLLDRDGIGYEFDWTFYTDAVQDMCLSVFLFVWLVFCFFLIIYLIFPACFEISKSSPI